MNKSEHLVYAMEISQEAGKMLLKSLGEELKIKYKKGNERNLVTEVDQKIENFLIQKIKERYPNHHILTEESGEHGSHETGFQWIIDPIDGTTNFSHGYPFFAISIGLKKNDSMVAGVVHAPLLREMYSAEKGKGAFLNDKRISVSAVKSLKKSMLATGFGSEHRLDNMPYFIRFHKEAQAVRRAGSAALDLCHVAAGRLDAYWEFGLQPWDIAAGILIVEEAGGKVTNVKGGPVDLAKGEIVASNGHIHEEILRVLRRKNEGSTLSE